MQRYKRYLKKTNVGPFFIAYATVSHKNVIYNILEDYYATKDLQENESQPAIHEIYFQIYRKSPCFLLNVNFYDEKINISFFL